MHAHPSFQFSSEHPADVPFVPLTSTKTAAGTEGHEPNASIPLAMGPPSKLQVLLGLALSIKTGLGSNNTYAPLL